MRDPPGLDVRTPASVCDPIGVRDLIDVRDASEACNPIEDSSGLLPFPPDESVPEQVRRLARSGVDFVQLREKHLPAAELAALARHLLDILAETAARDGTQTRLLINSRADVAAAIGAHGVHLPASPDGLTPSQVRLLFRAVGSNPWHGSNGFSARSVDSPRPIVSMACHSLPALRTALADPPDLILFSPVFGKSIAGVPVIPAAGLEALASACTLARPIPVLALGGVTLENSAACLHAGAAGIAAIRLFQTGECPESVGSFVRLLP